MPEQEKPVDWEAVAKWIALGAVGVALAFTRPDMLVFVLVLALFL